MSLRVPTTQGAGLAPQRRPDASRAIIRESLTSLRSHLGMQVAFVGRFAGGRRVFEYVDADSTFCPISAGQSDPLEETYCARVTDGRIPELIPDTAEVPALQDIAATAQLPVGSHMSVPMRDENGEPFGTLCCFSTKADAGLRERDLEVLRMFGDLIGSHMRFLIAHEQASRQARARIDRVIVRGGPLIALQPIVNLVTGHTYGYEALSRFPADCEWTPDRWFREAGSLGLGPALEASALRASFAHLPDLPEQTVLSVNVSARALFADPDIAAMFTASDHCARVVLELTEHDQVDDYEGLDDLLGPMRRAGVRVAVDDAGSGYAGLDHILQLRPEVLKLDRALIEGIGDHPGRQAMCEAMVRFTQRTGTMLVAEGVETESELVALRDLGVLYAQGYHLGRPTIPD